MIFASVETAGVALACTGVMAVGFALFARAIVKPGAILSRGAEPRYIRAAVRVGIALAVFGVAVMVVGIWA